MPPFGPWPGAGGTGGSVRTGIAGVGSIAALQNRAGQFIPDELGIGDWFMDGQNALEVANDTFVATILGRRVRRTGAGKLGVQVAAGQGYSFQNGGQFGTMVSTPRFDAWFLSSGAIIDVFPATAEFALVGLCEAANAGANPAVQIAGDTFPYLALMAHGPTSTVNYCIKVYDGILAKVVDTGVPISMNSYDVMDLASDGMGTFYVLKNGGVAFTYTDDRAFSQNPAMVTFFARNPAAVTASQIWIDYVYAAGMRS